MLQGVKEQGHDLIALLSQKIVGQSAATKAIVPYVYMYQSGLAPEGRPAGVFLLLGPTGTGKTKTVEAIADLLHGSEKKLLKIDCGEFQMEHETAKLIGAPPGYLGHRETSPMLTQQSLTNVTSENSDLALVLFDEIEKAAQSTTMLLLGILDKGILRLGDNTTVNFEKSLIFFTSNLGAREMLKEINPNIGFQSATAKSQVELNVKLEGIALGAVRKRFSPEFVNRIDAVVTYHPLDSDALEIILEHNILALQEHVNSRLGERCFAIEVTPESKQLLLRKGVSREYGARELKRTIHRELTQPLATMVARKEIGADAKVRIATAPDGDSLSIQIINGGKPVVSRKPAILIVDDNHDLLQFVAGELRQAGWDTFTAETGLEAKEIFRNRAFDAVVIDYMLNEDDGLRIGMEFQRQVPATQIILITGGGLSDEEQGLCEEREMTILYKPFLAEDILRSLRTRFRRAAASVAV